MNLDALRRMIGGSLFLRWSLEKHDLTFRRDGGWFWCAYDKTGRTIEAGRAATIEAALEQALDATRPPMANAAE